MNTIVKTALLTLGTLIASVQFASAGSLYELQSACRTGDFTACSAYNAAVFAQSGVEQPVLTQGYDPFAIIPATHVDAAPKAPTGDATLVESDVTAVAVTISQ